MAIDSSLFAFDLPAGTYNAGDTFQMSCIDGPSLVRSGRGTAVLKQMMVGRLANVNGTFRIHIKNSDWIDECTSLPSYINNTTAFDDHSGLIQFGCDNVLTQNSGWSVYLECLATVTTAADDSFFALIDVDYPAVSAVTDPDNITGIPTSIEYDVSNIAVNQYGSLTTAAWNVQNVDYFKAGYVYCLQAVELVGSGMVDGFLAFSSASGMGGLQRIVPLSINTAAIRQKIRYASKLVKGPMDVKIKVFNTTAGTGTAWMCHDYVKKAGN